MKFWQFSTLTTYLWVCAKLSVLHFDVSLFSNCGEKVMKRHITMGQIRDQFSGPSPCNWRTMIHQNLVLTVFHIDHKSQGVCKTVRTKFWCIIVLQLRGEGHEKAHNYGTDSGQIFRTFSPQLENNDTLNVVLIVLHTPCNMWSVWKTVGTTLKCIDVLQSRGEGPK